MTKRLEELFEKMAQGQVELQELHKETEKAMKRLGEVVADSIMFTNGLHDKVTKKETSEV